MKPVPIDELPLPCECQPCRNHRARIRKLERAERRAFAGLFVLLGLAVAATSIGVRGWPFLLAAFIVKEEWRRIGRAHLAAYDAYKTWLAPDR